MKQYIPAKKENWVGRSDTEKRQYFHEIVECISYDSPIPPGAFAIAGFASDEGVIRNHGRRGAALGPNSWRSSFSRLPISENFHSTLIDVGDVIVSDADLEASQERLVELISKLFNRNSFPIVIGGGHELSWPLYKAIKQVYPSHRVGVINLDAHWDLRPIVDNISTSGTPFRFIAELLNGMNAPFDYLCIGLQRLSNSFQLHNEALNLGAMALEADAIRAMAFSDTLRFIDQFLEPLDLYYLSLDMDVFADAFAPGVSAPQPFGLLPYELLPILEYLYSHPKIIAFSIAELSPPFDQNNRTARLAAQLTSLLLAKKGCIRV